MPFIASTLELDWFNQSSDVFTEHGAIMVANFSSRAASDQRTVVTKGIASNDAGLLKGIARYAFRVTHDA
jgi:hypothetical protein